MTAKVSDPWYDIGVKVELKNIHHYVVFNAGVDICDGPWIDWPPSSSIK